MSHELRERIKNIIIFVLIVTGISQVGILFGYQSQGSPTNLFLGLFRIFPPSGQVSDETARDRLFLPDRLVLSDGEKSYWTVGKESENFGNLWGEATKDLRSIASGNTALNRSTENWGDITEKKGVLVDFGYPVQPKLLVWFLGMDEAESGLPEITKFMIKPDIVDNNSGVVYILSSDNKVYASDSIYFGKAFNLEKTYTAVTENQNYRIYSTFRSSNIDRALNSPPDILYVSKPPKYWPYFVYNSRIPIKAKNRDELAAIILGNEKGRYDINNNINDSFQFSDNNNVYRIYSNGCLTYQYLKSGNSTDKGTIGDAVLNAYKFIDRTNQLFDTLADVRMTDIEEIGKGVYRMSFDYRIGEMPVRLGKGIHAGNSEELTHAVTIEADGKRVLKCVLLLREFSQVGRANCNDRFIELMALIKRGFDELKIRDIHTGYYLKSSEATHLTPNLLIDLNDDSILPVEMPAEK